MTTYAEIKKQLLLKQKLKKKTRSQYTTKNLTPEQRFKQIQTNRRRQNLLTKTAKANIMYDKVKTKSKSGYKKASKLFKKVKKSKTMRNINNYLKNFE
jgi:uncharacterized phage-like protein YoqJ